MMTVCCITNLYFILRFVRGEIPGLNTGFDVDEADLSEMRQCQGTVVASAIFGNCVLFLCQLYLHVIIFPCRC